MGFKRFLETSAQPVYLVTGTATDTVPTGASPSIAGASSAVAVTPSDSTDLVGVRGLYVGVGGDVSVVLEDDSTPVTLKGMVAGAVYPLRVKRVRATGTTASSIVALK